MPFLAALPTTLLAALQTQLFRHIEQHALNNRTGLARFQPFGHDGHAVAALDDPEQTRALVRRRRYRVFSVRPLTQRAAHEDAARIVLSHILRQLRLDVRALEMREPLHLAQRGADYHLEADIGRRRVPWQTEHGRALHNAERLRFAGTHVHRGHEQLA